MLQKSLLSCLGILSFFVVPMVHAAEALSSDTALEQLITGNKRFCTAQTIHPNQDAVRRKVTNSGGQHPFTTVISCSDSRVVPEILFDQGIGDVFVVRVAGNVCDSDEIGSIEYGVEHLKTPLLVVLGHSNCGAVTAVVTGGQVHGSIPGLVDNIVPAAKRASERNPKLHGKELVPIAIRENVWVSIEDLLRRSPMTCELVQEGSLQIVGAMYDIETGEVEWMGKHPNQAQLLKNTAEHESSEHESKPKHE
ncbi:MAG: carbonic anhydrase [bacterium]|nr:carbonic anhydrase [bacterium]